MKIAKIKHFAKALVASCQTDWIEAFSDLNKIQNYLKDNLKFKNFLLAKNIKLNQKQEFLIKELKLSEKASNFVLLLIDSSKILKLETILTQANEIYNNQNNIEEVFVESVVEITSKQSKLIQDSLESKLNKKVKLNNVIKPEIKGGFVLKIKDNIIDLSILGKIKQLKNNLNTVQ